MRLSPLDIQHMEFASSLSGYTKRQVRDFLERVAEAHEELLRENARLTDELHKQSRRVEELQSAEADLKRAVIAAERIGNEMKINAKREAELMLRDAEQRKEHILREAQLRIKEAQADIARLEKERDLFREQFRGMLHAFERSIDHVGGNAQRRGTQAENVPAAVPVKNAAKRG
jgi:cell division initiation protein